MKTRVCVIGAGPGGIFSVRALNQLDPSKFEVVCYERYDKIGGQWNFSGAEGIEKDGMPVHTAMYHGLTSNVAKEIAIEVPDMQFDENVKSYVDLQTISQFVQDYGTKFDISKSISFQKWVENVEYNESREVFEVTVKDLVTKKSVLEIFDYIIVACGNFNYPKIVAYPGQETFPGLVIHAKEFMDAKRYTGKRVLLVGGSFSAEDLALKLLDANAARVNISHRMPQALGFKWPPGIEERAILENINGSTVSFKDGSTDDYDVIIYCTGYLQSYPFMARNLKPESEEIVVPPLYLQTVFPRNGKVIYIGMQKMAPFVVFWMQGKLAAKVISGEVHTPSEAEMLESVREEQERVAKCKSLHDFIEFIIEYVAQLQEFTGNLGIDFIQAHRWIDDRYGDINHYREKEYTSIFPKTLPL